MNNVTKYMFLFSKKRSNMNEVCYVAFLCLVPFIFLHNF